MAKDIIISHALRDQLSWTHYRHCLIMIEYAREPNGEIIWQK